ncbi:MAG: M81 family metallopeptidase [Chloroflexi bacterium]|nr:M81 family metallopeptidase [Chloroflexota bacterium]
MSSTSPSPSPRIAIGGILHETHTFMEQPTTLADFEMGSLCRGEDLLREMIETRSGIGGMIEAASARGWRLLPTLYATAMPAGTVTKDAYQGLLTDLLDRLRRALPLDGLLLALHGAMVAEGELDVEADIVARARNIVGAETPIVVLLDMHGNISPGLVEVADVLLAYDSNPHIDTHARGVEAVDVMARLLRRAIVPSAAYARPALLLPPQSTGTDDEPLSLVHARAAKMEAEAAVVCIAVMAGFAYADTPYCGASIIVTSDNQPELARQYARELSDLLRARRDTATPRSLGPAEAVAGAAQIENGPVILVDSADNIGGGTPGDGTDALKAMLDQDVKEGAIVLADAEAVAHCRTAGTGETVTLHVGAKADNWHGEPVLVTGRVQALSDGVFRPELPDNHFAAFYGNEVRMGHCAWLRVDGVNILLTARKTPPMDLAQLRHIGIIPEDQRMIVVKSAVAYRAAYLPIATAVIEMDTAGLCSANLRRFPYRHLNRPVFPLD